MNFIEQKRKRERKNREGTGKDNLSVFLIRGIFIKACSQMGKQSLAWRLVIPEIPVVPVLEVPVILNDKTYSL